MQMGTIKNWNSARGFGFVKLGGPDVFLLAPRLADRLHEPDFGQRLQFELGTDQHACKPEAQNVMLLES